MELVEPALDQEEDWNADFAACTVRVKLFGRNAAFLARRDFLGEVKKFGFEDIISMWKEDSQYEALVAFKSPESATKFKAVANFKVGAVTCVVTDSNDEVNDVRVHWTPTALTRQPLDRFFRSRGFLICDYEEEKHWEDGIGNGVRRYRLVGQKEAWKSLPHLLKWENSNVTVLLVVPGRPPLCLKCRQHGHTRSQCPKNYRGQPRTQTRATPPASSTGPRRWEKLPPRNSSEMTATPTDSSLQVLGRVNRQADRQKMLQEVKEHLDQQPATEEDQDSVPSPQHTMDTSGEGEEGADQDSDASSQPTMGPSDEGEEEADHSDTSPQLTMCTSDEGEEAAEPAKKRPRGESSQQTIDMDSEGDSEMSTPQDSTAQCGKGPDPQPSEKTTKRVRNKKKGDVSRL